MPYDYIDVVKLGINAGNARVPRLQKSAIIEFSQVLSREVAAGEWQQDGEGALNSAGQNVEQYLDHMISTRPHWEVPATVVDAADDTWTSGDLTKQGKRWNELKRFLGSDAATNAAINAEAALYGTKMGSTKKGTKPGDKKSDGDADLKSAGPNNPWSEKYRGTPQEADAEKARLIRTLGTKGAASIAKAAGYTVLGAKIAK
jgi:hypothetical protein